jgi:2-oxoglutarate ferredoxin oxidoreductase subunit alpha
MRKVKNSLRDIVQVEEFLLDDPEIVIIAFGSVARVARAAVREARSQGIKAGLLRLITLWPFPKFHVERLPENLRAIIVPEMNFGQIVGEVLKYYRGSARVYPYNRVDSELMTVEEILKQIREV